MTNRDRYQPIGNAQNEWLESQVSLPFGLHQEMDLDAKWLSLLRKVAALSRITITSHDDGPTSQAMIAPAGMAARGVAAAGKGGTIDRVPGVTDHLYYPERYSGESEPRNFPKQMAYPELHLEINLAQVKQELLHKDLDLRKVEVWVDELNSLLIRSIVLAGSRHLLRNFHRIELALMAMYYGTDVILGMRAYSRDGNFDSFSHKFISEFMIDGLDYWIYMQLTVILLAVVTSNKPILMRPAFLVGIELERYLILLALSKMITIVSKHSQPKG